MRMRRAMTKPNGSGAGLGRRGELGRGADAGWRSHTFADGVCSITLTGALDRGAADRLAGRLRELCERGCDRLIVDVSAAVAPAMQAPGLLAAVFRSYPLSAEVVVVTSRSSVLDGLLPARVAVAWCLSDARRLLGQPSNGRGGRAPASTIGAEDRHVLAVRQALRWASQTAGTGDYEGALRGLATIERVEGRLPERWQARRRAWLAASREQAASRSRPRRRALHPPSLRLNRAR